MQEIRARLVRWFRALDDAWFDGRAPQRILFVLPDSVGAHAAEALVRELHSRPLVKVRYIELSERSACMQDLTALRTTPRRARWQKWHQIVFPHLNSFAPARNALKVYLHHGTGFGIRGTKRSPATYSDVYLGCSDIEKSFIEKHVGPLFSERLFIPVGMPKTDLLARKTVTRTQARARLGLPDRTTIVIASHWLPEGLLPTLGAAPLSELAAGFPDCNIVQIAHPWTFSRPEADRLKRHTLLLSLRKLEARFGNVRLLHEVPPDHVLMAADALVCDHSSIAIDFALLDRPLCVFFGSQTWFTDSRIEDLYKKAGPTFERASALVPLLKGQLSDATQYSFGRGEMVRFFLCNPGNASAAAADALLAIGPLCSRSSRRWAHLRQSVGAYSHEYPVSIGEQS